jgi:hypothetical protein
MNLRATSTFRAGQFAALEALLVPKLLAAAQAAGEAVLSESQSAVPRRTGELADSGGVTKEWVGMHVTSYVVYSAGHAAFVEFGTGITGRGTYPYDLPQSGVPITGSWIYDYKQQNWHGMHSKPYLRPALDTGRGAALDAFRAALVV